jgi:3-hydroxybutyryl-CoA dehydrogenase
MDRRHGQNPAEGKVTPMVIREVGIVGLGTMGTGIAEVFARAGIPVTAVEADRDALDRGMSALESSLDRAVSRGKLTGDERAEIARRIRPGAMSELSAADLIVEVVPEQLAIKRRVLAELDEAVRPSAVIATNTSSLSVTAIAAGSAHPGRVVGMHFFNPAPVMRLVEVVTTVLTDQAAGQAVTALARRLGKTPVQVTDRAGFVANALLLPYLNHAVRLLESGHATREDIDLAMTAGAGLPMGPLALLDLIGLDTSLAILEVLEREFGGTRYTPAPLLRRLAEAGRAGRKSGSGFYDYSAPPARPTGSPEPAARQPDSLAPGTVTLIDPAGGAAGDGEGAGHFGRAAELAILIEAAGIGVTRDPAHPTDLAIVAVGPQGGVLGPAAAAGRAADAVGMYLAAPRAGSPEPPLAEIVPSPLTSAGALAVAEALAARLELREVRSADRPGLLLGALLYPHLRDAIVMIGDGYATASDIDTAMTLGCGYPQGPVRMLAQIGAREAAAVLGAMHAGFGDPAFAPPPLLTQYAASGLSPLGLAGDG